MGLWRGGFRLYRHTRQVTSGSPPLYRMIVLLIFVSGVLQLALDKAPVSVTDTTPQWFTTSFVWVQLVASIMILVSLQMEDGASHNADRLHLSLSIEWAGLLFLQAVILVNLVAIWFNDAAPPTSIAALCEAGFGLWCSLRILEIIKAIRKLTAPCENAPTEAT